MKKKISLLLSAIMVVGMIPATAFAVTTNTVSKVITGSVDDLTYSVADANGVAVVGDMDDAPMFKIDEKSIADLNTAATTSLTFKASLTNAEFKFVGTVGTTPNQKIETGNTGTFVYEGRNITVNMLGSNLAMITADINNLVAPETDNSIKFPIAAELTNEGDATISIDNNDTIISAGTYRFANVVDGATTTTIEKKTDLPENGATIKPIIITETSKGALKGSNTGYFKLKLTNGFEFVNEDSIVKGGDGKTGATPLTSTTKIKVSAYPGDKFETFTARFSKDLDELYIYAPNFVDNAKTAKSATISISGLKVAYDSEDVNVKDIAEITVDGYEMSKATVEVGTAVSYGVTVEAENKTVPVFVAGRYDKDKDSLKVTMKETIYASWLDARKTTITFPEGIKATIDTEDIKDGFTQSKVGATVDHKSNKTVITLPTNLTRETNKDKGKMEFKFNISADPGFTGDVVATFGGAGLEADMPVVIGTVVAPVTVVAEPNEVKIDYRNVAIKDFTIKETEAGYLKKDSKLYLGIDHLNFDGTPTVEVVEGDLKIEKVKIVDGSNSEGDKIEISIKTSSSKTPAVLKVSGAELFLDRSVPAGTYELTLANNNGTKADVTTVENSVFRNYQKDSPKDTLNFDTDKVVVLKDFVKVVTAGRDQDDSTFTTTISVTIGASKLVAGDKEIDLDVPAYIANGYTMLPVRAVTEALSEVAIVRWDDATKTVTITFGSRVISMTVGSKTMNVNGVPVPMQAACEITDSRAFIPLRDLGNALGLNDSKINWDDASKTAKLN